MKSTRAWYVDEVLTCKAELQSGQQAAGGETGAVVSQGFEASVQGHFGMSNRRYAREVEALQEWMTTGGGKNGKLGRYDEKTGMMVDAGMKGKMSKALIDKTNAFIEKFNADRQKGSKSNRDFSQSYLRKFNVDFKSTPTKASKGVGTDASFSGISRKNITAAREDYKSRIAALAKSGDLDRNEIYNTIQDIMDEYGD